MKTNKVLNTARTLQSLRENPIEFLLDLLITTVVSALIPLPFAGELVKRYKKQILFAIGGIIVFVIGFICLLLVLLSKMGTNTITTSITNTGLQGYIEAGFVETDTPMRNPLGGDGFINTETTMEYHDARYGFFDGIHTGIDLIPSETYYMTNQAYKKTGEPIVFATMNGTAKYFVDQYGANTVDITNASNTLLTRYIHLQTAFVATGQQIQAGQPIGVMGSTGESTGVHLHYELRVNQNGTFTTVNPRGYIQ
jgi:murein DD-endopeptidase MepM/ murein hydrolase activator NlpD